MDKKYILNGEVRTISCLDSIGTSILVEIYRIEAARSFSNVKKGDLGGWIQSEKNLSHEGNCWIYSEAIVCQDAQIYDDAQIKDNAKISEKAQVFNKALVQDGSKIFGSSKVYGQSKVIGHNFISDNAQVYDNAQIQEECVIHGHAEIYGNALIIKSYVDEYAKIYGESFVINHSKIKGSAEINTSTTIDYAVLYDGILTDDKLCYIKIGPIDNIEENYITINLVSKSVAYTYDDDTLIDVTEAYKDNRKRINREHLCEAIKALLK